MIVKIQKSLAKHEGKHLALIYDESRNFIMETAFEGDIEKLFQPEELKLFAEVRVRSGEIIVVRKVEWQDW